jgi:RNA polymerase sigma-70 factor (sigma-E family)
MVSGSYERRKRAVALGAAITEHSVEPAGAAAFDAFYREQFDRMARLAYLLTGDSAAAEDLAQEALSRVQGRFDRLNSPVAYIRTTLVNLCKRHRGDRARERVAVERLRPLAPAPPEARELFDAIEALPARQRAVVVLRYYEDLSEAEIAASLGCRPGTVKSLSARALRSLRRTVER